MLVRPLRHHQVRFLTTRIVSCPFLLYFANSTRDFGAPASVAAIEESEQCVALEAAFARRSNAPAIRQPAICFGDLISA